MTIAPLVGFEPTTSQSLVSYHNHQTVDHLRTEYVEQGQELTEEVSVCPEVVVLEVGVQVVQQQLLFRPFLGLGDDAQVKVHLECSNLSGLPILPQPPRDVEQNGLKQKLTFTKNCFTKSVVKRKEPGKSLQLISKLEKHNPSRKNYCFHFDCFYEKVAL